MVCDACLAELREVEVLEYRPAYYRRGNDGYLRVAS